MPTKRDPIKLALADLVFKAVIHAVKDLPTVANDPAHEPLEDCVIELMQVSDTEALIEVNGHGQTNWYSIKVQQDNS